jgi:hypothetical protein
MPSLSPMNTRHLGLVALLALPLASIGSAATVVDTSTLPSERFNIRLGGFFVQDIDSQLRIDAKTPSGVQRGTDIDLGKNLNIEDSVQVFRVDFSAYLAKRHRLDFSWFNMNLEGRTVLLEDV